MSTALERLGSPALQDDEKERVDAPERILSPQWPRRRAEPPLVRTSSYAEMETLLRREIRTIPDFPRPGFQFKDITTLLLDPAAFQLVIDAFARRYRDQQITHVAGCESRGFIFAAPLALALKCAFVPVRKARKLPGHTIGVDYHSQFTKDRLEIHDDAITPGSRVVVMDDMVATGGTLLAACELVQKAGGVLVECAVVVLEEDVNMDDLASVPLFSLLHYGVESGLQHKESLAESTDEL